MWLSICISGINNLNADDPSFIANNEVVIVGKSLLVNSCIQVIYLIFQY